MVSVAGACRCHLPLLLPSLRVHPSHPSTTHGPGAPCCGLQLPTSRPPSTPLSTAPAPLTPAHRHLLPPPQHQRGVPLHKPGPAPADQAHGDRLELRPRLRRHRRHLGSPRPNHLPVCGYLHQGSPLLDLRRVPVQPQHLLWLVLRLRGVLPCDAFFLV